ncbi:unnamed protein product [Spodoptera exigua]|nr:unnamed protein product [Spodoptera exigua]
MAEHPVQGSGDRAASNNCGTAVQSPGTARERKQTSKVRTRRRQAQSRSILLFTCGGEHPAQVGLAAAARANPLSSCGGRGPGLALPATPALASLDTGARLASHQHCTAHAIECLRPRQLALQARMARPAPATARRASLGRRLGASGA